MMKRIIVFSLVIVLVAVTYTAALAQEETEIPACEDGTAAGTVVDFDEETGLVTLDIEGELCTVTQTSEYGHPITNLLGAYFSEISTEGFTEALDDLTVCVLFDGETYSITAPDEEGICAEGDLVTVTGTGDEGGFEGQTEGGEPYVFELEDEEAAAALIDALGSLQADWVIQDGNIGDVGAEIGTYHDDGYGFGTLVKVYAIADEAKQACTDEPAGEPVEEGSEEEVDPCAVSVELLLEELDGKGMGQIFQVYGKPSIVGIGHVRNIGESDGPSDGTGSSAKGICNARAHGGKANAKGQPDINCDDADTGEPEGAEDPEGDD